MNLRTMNLRTMGATILALGLMVCDQLPAAAQWTATILHHPPGALSSVGYGAGAGAQVGATYAPGEHASLWTGSAASLVDLHPAGASASRAYDVEGLQQAGVVEFGFTSHAAIWYGTAASFVDLHPVGASESEIRATDGANQAGGIDIGLGHAAVWSSTPGSMVDIHPGVADASGAFAIDGFEVGGAIYGGFGEHAGYWATPTHIFTDLHPAGTSRSVVRALVPGLQGGDVSIIPTGAQHAALWSGSAASFVDMNPPGYAGSTIAAMDGAYQVGWAYPGPPGIHAGIWSGTAASFIDLHAYLPAGYTQSQAEGVWTDGLGRIQVVGYANHLTDAGARLEAVLWTIPEPSTAIIALGMASALLARRRRRGE